MSPVLLIDDSCGGDVKEKPRTGGNCSEASSFRRNQRLSPLAGGCDATILAKLYPCLGQGIHNSRDHNIPYMYELTGAPMSALSRPPSRMGVECGSQGWRRLHAANT